MIWTAITCEKISKTVWSLSCTTDMGAVTETSSSGSQKQTVANKLCGNLQLLAFITDQVIRFIHHFYQEKPWGKKITNRMFVLNFDQQMGSHNHVTIKPACGHVVMWCYCYGWSVSFVHLVKTVMIMHNQNVQELSMTVPRVYGFQQLSQPWNGAFNSQISKHSLGLYKPWLKGC